MRIVSLLPSTTEIVAALDRQDLLVGRSHECDYPADVVDLPSCTEPKFDPDGSSYKIDQRVKALLQEGLSVYRVDEEQLAALDPDIIITQDHCEVCAASVDEVRQAVHSRLGEDVEVISVSPSNLAAVVDSIRTIGEAIEAKEAANNLLDRMKSQLESIQQKVIELRRPRVLAIEWMDPLMSAGNWVPDLVEIAGGQPLAAEAGEHSPKMEWSDVQKLDPDIVALLPCGYSIHETLSKISDLTSRNGWENLSAVKNQQVFVLDGNQYFNRPGPRLVESTRILGEIIHPSVFRDGNTHSGWINLSTHQFHQQIQ